MKESQKEESKSARHTLLSVYFDASNFLRNVIQYFYNLEWFDENITETVVEKTNNEFLTSSYYYLSSFLNDNELMKQRFPIVANERCGTWYAYPYANAAPNTHFKSTDGHKNIYNFSLKRLNLKFLSTACMASQNDGAVLIVDASRTKVQPDSFSRTLPIWCCVLNRLVLEFRRKRNRFGDYSDWDTKLYTPPIISDDENRIIMDILPKRVKTVLDSGVILDEEILLQTLMKPLRCFWINNDGINGDSHKINHENLVTLSSTIEKMKDYYTCIICISVSEADSGSKSALRPICIENGEEEINSLELFRYTPGATDDHEFASFAKGLTPDLFWKHHHELLFQKGMTIEDTDQAVRKIMKEFKDGEYNSIDTELSIVNFFDTLEGCNISIGSRKSGRPPYCWDHFDAILNVTDMEYSEMASTKNIPEGKYYLQLKVKEGKKDRSELEKWMAVAMMFVGIHAAGCNRRVLIHCAQGKDRSVAVAVAAVCLFCQVSIDYVGARNEIVYHSWCSGINHQSFINFLEDKSSLTGENEYLNSGIPETIVTLLIGRLGKNILFEYLKSLASLSNDTTTDCTEEALLASKETIRLSLIAIQQFRDQACPSRKTMQKLNRFFMSNLNQEYIEK